MPQLANPRIGPGLVDSRPQAPAQSDGHCPSLQYLVCHHCYYHGYISPDCILTLPEMKKVIENSEKSSAMEKAKAPATSYQLVRAALGMDKSLPES